LGSTRILRHFTQSFRKLFVLCGIAALVCVHGAWAASVPALINYQGTLTDENGLLLETGPYTLAFGIFDDENAETPVWGPQVFEDWPVVNGAFNVILGELDSEDRPIIEGLRSGNAYLAIFVDDQEILPRQRIPSVPYAMYAAHDASTPVGSVQNYFGGNPDPPGWLTCDGRTITTDQALATSNGYEYNPAFGVLIAQLRGIPGYPGAVGLPNTAVQIPDLRGVFLRGHDPNGTRDPQSGRAIGSYQQDEFKSHTHPENAATGIPGQWVNAGGLYNIQGGGPGTTGATGGPETRPKNVAAPFIIKY